MSGDVLKTTGVNLKLPLRENEMEDPPYMETYIKISSISDPAIYNLLSKYCRNDLKTSAKDKDEHY